MKYGLWPGKVICTFMFFTCNDVAYGLISHKDLKQKQFYINHISYLHFMMYIFTSKI